MNKQTYFYISAIIFTIATFLHLVRALSGWPILVGGIEIPAWVSWVVVIVGAYLAMQGFNHSHKR